MISVENTKNMQCKRILKSRTKKKYNVILIKRDNKCLFRSLAFFIRGDEEEYPEIEREIFNYARDKCDSNIIQKLLRCLPNEKYASAEEYINDTFRNGKCTELDISIFTELYKVNVVLCNLRSNEILLAENITSIKSDDICEYLYHPNDDDSNAEYTYYLLFTGECEQEYFQVLEEQITMNDTDKMCNITTRKLHIKQKSSQYKMNLSNMFCIIMMTM